jgi:Zn-dependent M28 family amino/carboxypeptidase
LVTQFGPEHPNYYKPFIGDNHTLASTSYPKNNLIRGLKYAYAEFNNLGYTLNKEWIPVYLDGSAYTVYNIVAEKTGNVHPEKIIEIGAHIDNHTGTPGASDNAGSVGAILEMARLLKDYSNRYTIRFVIYVGEEYGLIGSRYHVKLLRDQNSQVKASLVMDGTGWSEIAPLKMNCIWDNGDPATRKISQLFDQARKQYHIDISWRLCSPTDQVSDNVAYWEQGFPSVLSIGGLPYADPNYHKRSDSMSSVDLQNVYLTAQENLAVLLRLDLDDSLIDTTQFQNLYIPSERNASH